MQKLEHKDKIYNIPTRWEDISIGQLYEINSFIEKLNDDDGYDDEYLYSNLFKIITSTNGIEYYSLSIPNNIFFKNSIKFLNTEIKNEPFKQEIVFGNLKFKVKKFDEFTFGEYIDTQHMSSTENINIVKLLALLVDIHQRPNIFKLKFKSKKLSYTFEQKEKIINSLPATKLMALQTFFLRGQKQLGRNLASYLNMMALRLTMKASFQLVGLFISGLWMRVMKTLQRWIKPSKNHSKKY